MLTTLAPARAALTRASEAAALAGGLALAGAALFTVGAVIADAAGAPLLGDSEVVELVVGAAVFAFLPLCQMRDGHIAITLFTDRAPAPARRALDLGAALLTLAVALVLTWRLAVGGLEVWERGRASMFLQLPLWWGYAAATAFALLWTAAAALVAAERALGLRARPPSPPADRAA
jgi:TRAP-type C4-dicarboxylate transport system permease small subunit